MTTYSTRLNLPIPQGTDQPNGPAQIGALANALDGETVVKLTGLLANRPAPAIDGRLYETTDTTAPIQVFYDTGTAWVPLGGAAAIAAKGDILIGSAPSAELRLPVGSDGFVLTARSSSTDGVGVDWEAVPLPTPPTAKGDLHVASAASTEALLHVGTDGYVLTARSTATDGLGVDWEALPPAVAPPGPDAQVGQSVFFWMSI